jgi:AcrR family transcriptional regulator
MGQRQAAVDDTRQRVLAAARALLGDPSGYKAFTIDAVARAADVARPTVYYQFGSKTGLIEALCDDLAVDGRLDLAPAFSSPDPLAGLRHLVVGFAQFWASQRLLTRRLRALAALDPEVGLVIAARDERRRQALRVLIGRLADDPELSVTRDADTAVAVLLAITSFETFDVVAAADTSAGAPAARVGELIAELVPGALGIDPAKPRRLPS